MKKEDKELLIKDLYYRLQYQPQVEIIKDGASITDKLTTATIKYLECGYWDVKPYLFPMSSMTEDQKSQYHDMCDIGLDECGTCLFFDCIESIDWLNKNHFDYRGLIEKGLAIDATNLNIY